MQKVKSERKGTGEEPAVGQCRLRQQSPFPDNLIFCENRDCIYYTSSSINRHHGKCLRGRILIGNYQKCLTFVRGGVKK